MICGYDFNAGRKPCVIADCYTISSLYVATAAKSKGLPHILADRYITLNARCKMNHAGRTCVNPINTLHERIDDPKPGRHRRRHPAHKTPGPTQQGIQKTLQRFSYDCF
jgi:hypothetical protein